MYVGYVNENVTPNLEYIKNNVPNGRCFILYGSHHAFIGMKRSASIYSYIYFDYGSASPLYVCWGTGSSGGDHSDLIALVDTPQPKKE